MGTLFLPSFLHTPSCTHSYHGPSTDSTCHHLFELCDALFSVCVLPIGALAPQDRAQSCHVPGARRTRHTERVWEQMELCGRAREVWEDTGGLPQRALLGHSPNIRHL